ncbi:hypothetical protein FSP39_005405 [Pinctada imbricata]|uniref:Uncharacterized protein n=1 Tax=Pinctada imbricata TaxID=66713 RepID=A0AA88YB92_PINIB|nr:hypothetical protein FSP39_005405 [Pinctada imbricata]
MEQMKEDLSKFSSEFCSQFDLTSRIEDMWKAIKTQLNTTLDKCVPSKMTSTRYNQPWINREVKQLSRRKKRSFKRARETKSARDRKHYQHLKKATRNACKRAYDSYISNIVSPDSHSNPKKFWSFISSKKTESTGVAPLKSSDGLTYSDQATKANILNEQFSSVFNANEDLTTIEDIKSPPYSPMPDIEISTRGVQKLLAGLNIHKASGPDGVSTRLLKSFSSELAPSSPCCSRPHLTRVLYHKTGRRQM